MWKEQKFASDGESEHNSVKYALRKYQFLFKV